MKRLLIFPVLLAAACGGPRLAKFPEAPPPPPPVAVIEVLNPNFEAVVIEAVPNADDEGVSFTKIFVDGTEAGTTSVGFSTSRRPRRIFGGYPDRPSRRNTSRFGTWSTPSPSLTKKIPNPVWTK